MGLKPVAPSDEIRLVIRAWNLMGGIDWAALPDVIEMFGFKDPELLIRQLAAIRDYHSQNDSQE